MAQSLPVAENRGSAQRGGRDHISNWQKDFQVTSAEKLRDSGDDDR